MNHSASPATPSKDAPIAFFFDFVSPYAYLALSRAEQLAAAFGRALDLRPVLLGVTVMRVMGLKPVPQTPLKGPYARADVERLALLHSVPFRHHGLPEVNPVAAMRAFLSIKQHDPLAAHAFARRVFERLWVQGKDISAPEQFGEDVAAVGCDAGAVQAACATAEARDALRAAVDDAIAQGVFGVPFFIADGESFWGGDRLPMLEHWLTHHSWQPGASALAASREGSLS
jgi:2-hydroxychromene-2-carboxylate isomerase